MDENAKRIESAVLVTLPTDRIPSEAEVADLVARFSVVFPITLEQSDQLLKRLHARLAIKMDTGTALVARDHKPWLHARKPSIEPFYFDRYSKYLFSLGWVPGVVNTIDKVTDEILDLAGDPKREGRWRRRGLVMGDVQSGKTATYTALCCKAADSGYRLIILLTGTLESLRRQTQERLDAGFIGLDSSGFLSPQRQNRAVGVGLIDRARYGAVFTSRTSDFSINRVNQLNFRLAAFNEPILLVVKKNKKILQNLENWLRDYNAAADGKIATPLLLIDDEADNASVNTRAAGEDPTAINERIRALLGLFSAASYTGFTATPFANIFIDPESVDEMIGDDLFPRDFMYALEPPSNYLGPDAIFGDDRNGQLLCDITDAEAIFPVGHKASLQVNSLPESLLEALRHFLIANAVRDLRREGRTHRSMLVNVSRFTDVQTQVARLLEDELRAIQSDVRNYGRLKADQALRHQSLALLHKAWEEQFDTGEFPWRAVQEALKDAVLPIVVRAVNQRTGAASLDYAPYASDGLRVVAVGGNSLSRGLTLEGLCTSYFFRNSQMYDTLLQMGRWFGYRDSYGDLCGIWLTSDAQHWYAHITEATDELRSEIRKMQALNLTPGDFGLRIRAHPDALIVTARNKMRTAKTVERVISVSGEGLETAHLLNDKDSIRLNASLVRDFIRELAGEGIARVASPYGRGNAMWLEVHKKRVADLLRRFRVHPRNVTFQGENLADLIERISEPRLQTWDVVLPSGDESPEQLIEGLTLQPQKRVVRLGRGADLLVSRKSARVGSRGVEREGVDIKVAREAEEQYRRENPGKKSVPDHVYRAIRSRPLLLLHWIRAVQRDGDAKETLVDTFGEPLIALGLSFPKFDDTDQVRRVAYRVNVVDWRSLFEDEIDDELDVDDDAG